MSVTSLAITVIMTNFIASISNLYEKNSKKIVLCLVLVILPLFFSVRSMEIPDTEAYYSLFTKAKNTELRIGTEPFYILIMRLFQPMGFRIMLFCITLFNEILILKSLNNFYLFYKNKGDGFALDKYDVYNIGLSMYFSYFGLFYNGVAVREGIAMSIALLAVSRSIINSRLEIKTLISNFLLILVGCMFHISCFIGAAIIFVIHIKRFTKRFYYFWWCSVLLFWLVDASNKIYCLFRTLLLTLAGIFPFFFSRYAYYVYYQETIRSDGMFSKKDFLFMLAALILVLFYDGSASYGQKLNVYFTGITAMVLLNSHVLGYRFYDYFLEISIPIFSIEVFGGKKWRKLSQNTRRIMIMSLNFVLTLAMVRYLLSVMK